MAGGGLTLTLLTALGTLFSYWVTLSRLDIGFPSSYFNSLYHVYGLVLHIFLAKARNIREQGASGEEKPPQGPAMRHSLIY